MALVQTNVERSSIKQGKRDDILTLVARAVAGKDAPTLSFVQKMIAGACARGVAQTVLHPIDVIRTRLQAKHVRSSLSINTFLKGVVPQITLAVPAGAIQFLAFEYCKEKLRELIPDEKLQSLRDLLAGAGGALAASVIRVPQEVLKQRIQADVYPNIAEAIPMLFRQSGVMGLYTGYVATISRDVPWNALSFLFHAQVKRLFAKVKDRAPTNDENLVLASVAGSLAAVIMTPVDVVKTRLMTQKAGEQVYSGIVSTFNRILQEEGAAALFKGLVPRILFLAPLAGITLSVYEAIAKFMLTSKPSPQVAFGAQPVPRKGNAHAGTGRFYEQEEKRPTVVLPRKSFAQSYDFSAQFA
mmetsp:Transcript_7600/g.23044  ORF Transcript_7600/g.23044 Transcript_7600/m.23044 type:complete len:356 (-) Transcript_7600:1220-2287(-)|eukprot:CAMPEP_0198724948 /NCGR_PEP_ID=MMETSP1475-20131203/2325_1 /TAXON_ID= ORGANISM="Unidentified sp., Strain CCMP1999" /NCGR_SAMPLE_ID=MMETSP1475 /ASSEMBLY_ACC=CAM_ASM_001111 /LENGTH=355 /DNA_ID=CAMNT_0044486597 /DNA_START=95 /DNA_END=1162 /DNA_ORIENTATION=-